MRRGAWAIAFVLIAASVASAQPSTFQVSAAAQIFAADPYRLGTMNRVEPDLGFAWTRPHTLRGSFGLDLNVTRRGDRLRLGRAMASLKDARAAGFTWSLSAGDTGTPPFVPDFGFSNLHAPTLTFAGAAVAATNGRVTIRAAGGRTTQTRNLFGTDLVDLRQTLAQADVSWRVGNRLELTGRGSRVRNGDLGPYPTFVDGADDIGGGFRFKPTARWQVVADGGLSRFQRRGSHANESAPSWLVGSTFTSERGRFEINAQRFSVGRFAAMNYPYNDRQGVFASGEWQMGPVARLFGGADVTRTNLDPAASRLAAVAMPESAQTRAFGGLRVQVFKRSSLTLRAEGGGREMNPSRFTPGYETDSSAMTAEWHASLPGTSFFARYERRTNVDANYAPSSFRQHETSGQIYLHLPKGREIFLQGFLVRRADRAGGGDTDWYVGGGAQWSLFRLSARLEGTVGRTDDWVTGSRAERQMIAGGLSGQIAARTYLTADVVVTHAPMRVSGSHPWYTRSMVRVSRSFLHGSALVPAADGLLPSGGPSGTVDSIVFVDWDGNGARDAGDEPAENVGVVIAGLGTSPTGRDGQVSFAKVPVGDRLVGLDLTTVPADFDLPAASVQTVDVTRGKRAAVGFGLVPIGSITGAVFVDKDGDGRLSAADQPAYDAVLTIDDGARSELAREGRFRFDIVRLGRHAVTLEMDSLEEGAQLTGPSVVDVDLTRDTRTADVVFLVRSDKRPEIRKVFPARKIASPAPRAAAGAATASPARNGAAASRP